MICMGMVIVSVTMMVIMIIPQEICAEQVYAQAKYRNRDGLIECNWHGIYQPIGALISDEQSDHRQNNRARERREVTELSSTECEASIVHVPTRIGIGQCRDKKRTGVC